MRFTTFLAGREPDVQTLREYLRTRGEWAALEFKEAKQPSDFGLRIAVAAFANADGGDVFLGVENSGTPCGTPVDPVEISRVLGQSTAPSRNSYLTNLVSVVREPRRILFEGMPPVYWLDVAAQGLLVAVMKSDGTLGLYNRPGAESDEVRGFDAIDLYRRKTRARLLVQLYSEFKRIVGSIQPYYTLPNQVRDDTIHAIRAILESEEWRTVTTAVDRSMEGYAYLGPLLSFPSDAEAWERLPYQEKDNRWRSRMLSELPPRVQSFRQYLVNERIVPPD